MTGRSYPWGLKAKYTPSGGEARPGTCSCGPTRANGNQTRQPSAQATSGSTGTIRPNKAAYYGLTQKTGT